ncbi:DegV family protein [Brevibacterium atlanticum]|uniref:DegV family protein n=1 Tax=Brevibacterium atlanticum TaxID=2697563 RepID=UPI00141DBAA4|nr:DegV family protein [Brevibacterium atlanticum]
MKVGLVTDSTAQLTASERNRLTEVTDGLFRVVPLTVLLGGIAYTDGELDPGVICRHLADGAEVTTSMATPDQFAVAFRELLENGAEAIIVVTMSGDLSGTRDSAVAAAADVPVLVEVVDSRTTSAGLAGAVSVAAAGIAAGEPVPSITGTVADWCASETVTIFAPETLEYLRRGGRIGAASSLLGRALQIVPVLGLKSGVVVPVARVRTRTKALSRMSMIAAEAAADFEVDPAALQAEIQQSEGLTDDRDVVELDRLLTSRGFTTSFRTLSPIITAHVGPGALGVSVQTKP